MPLGLALLPGQAPDLALYFGDQILDPLQVAGRFLQAALGRLAPIAVEPDPGRLLEQRPPFFGPVGEQPLDHLRFDDHAGVAAESGAAQQVLDVAEPDDCAVEQVVRLAAAREAAGDLNLAIGDRQVAVGVVEEERDLGHVHRPACGGALEDHVLHLAAAEEASRLLAEHPAHGVGDVRLAAAVRADDGGDAVLEGERDRVGEGLEAGEFQLRQLHACGPCSATGLIDEIGPTQPAAGGFGSLATGVRSEYHTETVFAGAGVEHLRR